MYISSISLFDNPNNSCASSSSIKLPPSRLIALPFEFSL
nr:MAG TPA: hypothetical protein [Caudoviricetes sp.]